MKVCFELFLDFRKFCGPYLSSGDIDPAYPILRIVQRMRGMSPIECMWHTLLYVTWYNLGSAEEILKRFPTPQILLPGQVPILPTGLERRGFRGSVGRAKAVNLINWFVGGLGWAEVAKLQTWAEIQDHFRQGPGNGTWAQYKWADLMKNVIGMNITAPDIGVGGGDKNAGPIPGMVSLTGEDWQRCAQDVELQMELYKYCRLNGIPFDGLEEMETALCDFNSLRHGRYYIGHDIDKQQSDLYACRAPLVYWDARAEAFPGWALGERVGWCGVRKRLLTFYRDYQAADWRQV